MKRQKLTSRAQDILSKALGRVVGRTLRGPIFLQPCTAVIVPIPVALRNLHELALRVSGSERKLYGSQSRRATPGAAHWLWLMESAALSTSIQAATPAKRLSFLNAVLLHSRTQKFTDGIEPIIAGALNGAWKLLRPDAAIYMFRVAMEEIRRSEFAKTQHIPVLDISTHSLTMFEPGQLLEVDPNNALIDNYVNQVPHVGGPPPGDPGGGTSGLGNVGGRGGFGGMGGDVNGLGGFSGQGDFGGLGGRSGFGSLGGDVGGLGGLGQGGFGGFGGRSGFGSLGGDVGGLGGLGQGGFGGLGGRGGFGGLGGDVGGLGGLGQGGFGGLGGQGPFSGSGVGLGRPGGEASDAYSDQQQLGRGLMVAGGSIAAASAAMGGPSVPGAVGIGVGGIVTFVGWCLLDDVDTSRKQDDAARAEAAGKGAGAPAPVVGGTADPAPPPATVPAPGGGTPEPTDPEPEPEPENKPNPNDYPDPDSIRPTDLYPNPDGSGGGGPASLGVTFAASTMLSGPGLATRAIQVGPQTIAIL